MQKKQQPKTWVYFARARRSKLIKIGYSMQPVVRVNSVAKEVKEPVNIIFTLDGGYAEEQAFHKRFAHCRSRGEWFREEVDLATFIRQTQISIKQARAKARENAPVPVNGHPVPMILGYARVSTEEQDLSVQLESLKVANCGRIYQEKISAVDARRHQLRLLQKQAEPGDTVVVHSYSRLSRDLEQLLGIVRDFKKRDITLRSVSEPHIDPFSHHGKMILGVTGAVDEYERGQVRDRTKRAMQQKIAQGQYIGRPRLVTDEVAAKIRKMRKAKVRVSDIAAQLKISTSAIYNLK